MLFSLIELLSSLWFFALHIGSDGTFPKPLSSSEEKRFLQILKDAESHSEDEVKNAKEKLICHNMRLVAHVIKKYYSTYSDQDDLISIGTIGLIKSINSFDSSKGVRLATYAARCIENEILMHFRNVKSKQQYILLGESLECDSEGNPLTIMDIVCDDVNIEENTEKKLKEQKALQFVSEIKNDRDREIIIKRYGLNNTPPLTQREVAKELGISRSYVSRIEKRVLEKLRDKFNKE